MSWEEVIRLEKASWKKYLKRKPKDEKKRKKHRKSAFTQVD